MHAVTNNSKELYWFKDIKVANSISEEKGTIVAAVNEIKRRDKSLIDKVKDDGQLIEELYLTFYGRMPLPQEIEYCSEYLETADNRLVGASDIAWSLMNSLEFVFNH